MESMAAIWAVGMLFFTAAVGGANGRNCGFPAIFNFGDSNSDTGSGSTGFLEVDPPYGMSFPKLSKRASDGRLIIDFIDLRRVLHRDEFTVIGHVESERPASS
ncbi:hypothetical protein U1Q18_012447 [Sarracenia purpurea var. burkii]